MYLKSLELQGFKSFADKTKIELGGGIAAIVGPNGSGKSNIVEAIQWVLGEQKAKTLRGHKMQDVIFNGTKTRKPLGVAEISILLDNSDHSLDLDFTEVKVTRRLYRSGEGEYLINGKNVRLKDIHRLFADSGIGSDGYAVIGQGRIVEIIDSRPEDRRSIVEETAGVVKYRERKKEALRKIDSADQNLLRLTDIMTEIEGRLGPLETDAKNAEKYLEYAEEKDHLAIGMLGETFIDTRERLQKVEVEAMETEAVYQQMTAEIMAKEAKAAEQKAAIAMKNDEFHQKEQQYHRWKLEIEKAEGELRSLDTRIKGLQELQQVLKDGIDADEQKETSVSAELAEADRELTALKEDLLALADEMEKMRDRRKSKTEDLRKAEEEMDALRNKAFDVTNEGSKKKNQRLSAESRLEGILKRLRAIEEKFDHYDEEEDILDRRMEEINDRIDDLVAEEDDLAEQVKESQKECDGIRADIEKEREALVELKMRMNRGEARLKVLEELTLKREGFYPGVRAVLERKAKNGQSGIFGVIAELIHVEKDYTVAVEAVLGSALQNIVTETGEDAADAVAFLKEQRKGIATFLPLDLLRINDRRSLPKEILSHPSYIGNAADMVTTSIRVKPAVEYLLGNTLIFRDLKDAVALTRRFKGQFRMVTLDGDVINAGGSVSGGSREKSKNGFLQRQNEVDELRRLLLSGDRQAKEINDKIDELKDQLQYGEKKTARLMQKKEALHKDITAFDSEINNIDTRRELFDREREGLILEENHLLGDKEEIDRTLELLKKEIADGEKEEKRLMKEIGKREEAFRNAKTSDDESRDQYTKLQVSYAESKAICDNGRIHQNRIRIELEDIRKSLAEKRGDFARSEEERNNAEAQRKSLETTIMEKNRALLESSQALDEGRGERDSLNAELDAMEKEIRSMNTEANAKRDEVYKLSVNKERLAAEVQQCVEQLDEEYHMIPADAVPFIDREKTKKEKRERIKVLKQQIDALGVVNVGAIEEYKTVSERYDFLVEQRSDVLDAKASLENIVAEMDDIITKRFKETFDRINESFQQTFPAFFRGGQGELLLTDEKDLLNCGVDIVVQPPGKRLQHLSLLSGGEKSLSGIALLFAILKVKPSPFYVLDEIDAALDDANVRRFGDYLTEYGTDSQFLVITHRQGTMEAAETMYGVTMAEEGVSKTVSVKLS
ncbi:MAG: chromosome segregation protein SMC [Firmicutes bacterium]|nr:chromosome segregation protein SMC [Bacillota bacterium]